MLTHTEEKPYKCDICDKKFTKNCHVSRHMIEHFPIEGWKLEKSAIFWSQNLRFEHIFLKWDEEVTKNLIFQVKIPSLDVIFSNETKKKTRYDTYLHRINKLISEKILRCTYILR